MLNYNKLVTESHTLAKDKGWHDKPRSDAEMIMLMVTEVAEATEEVRGGKPLVYQIQKAGNTDPETFEIPVGCGEWLNELKPEGELIELADCVIRIADFFGLKGWDLASTISTEIQTAEGSPWKERFKSKTPLEQHLDLVYTITNAAKSEPASRLAAVIVKSELIAESRIIASWLDFEKIVEMKHTYNMTRAYRHGNKML